MDNNELINEFLDGNLNSELEDEFILKLSTSEEFRSEFKKYLAIEKSLKADAQSLTPSAKSTMGVFSSLGFNPYGSVAGGSFAYMLSHLFNRYSQGIIGGLIATALTTILFMLYLNFSDIKENQSIANNNVLAYTKSEPANIITPTEASESENANSNHLANVSKLSVSNKAIIRNDKINTSPIKENENEFNSKLIEGVNDGNNYLVPQVIHLGKEPSNINVSIETVEYVKIDKSKLGLSFNLFGNQYFSLLKPDVQFQSRPRFSNSGLGLSYKISDNIELAADFRQEYFYQQFEGYDAEGYKILISQYPNFYTLSAGIKWNLLKFDNVLINAGITGGGNQYGIIGRGLIGVDWYLSDDYKLIFGIESSIFRFTHNNNPFYSYKIGLTYGIGFDL